MKKLLSIASLIVISSFAQAMWEEIPYTGQFTLKEGTFAVGSKNNIWAVAPKKVKKGLRKKGMREKDFYLVKWNDQKRTWDERAFISKKRLVFYEGKITAASDGSVFVLKPRRALTKKERVQRNAIGKRAVTIPLLRFFDGKLEKIHDFGGEKTWVLGIAAVDKNQLLILKRDRFKAWVEKWNGTSFERMGKELNKVHHIFFGSDGSPYVAGVNSPFPQKERVEVSLFKWNGSTWNPTTIKIKKYLDPNFFVVHDKEIWFQVEYPAGTKFYRWDGSFLHREGMILAAPGQIATGAELKAVPGMVLVRTDHDGKFYRWVKRSKPRVGINPVRPWALLPKKGKR